MFTQGSEIVAVVEPIRIQDDVFSISMPIIAVWASWQATSIMVVRVLAKECGKAVLVRRDKCIARETQV